MVKQYTLFLPLLLNSILSLVLNNNQSKDQDDLLFTQSSLNGQKDPFFSSSDQDSPFFPSSLNNPNNLSSSLSNNPSSPFPPAFNNPGSPFPPKFQNPNDPFSNVPNPFPKEYVPEIKKTDNEKTKEGFKKGVKVAGGATKGALIGFVKGVPNIIKDPIKFATKGSEIGKKKAAAPGSILGGTAGAGIGLFAGAGNAVLDTVKGSIKEASKDQKSHIFTG
ncbi:hypothetical protein K502DRAFT_347004 [Neoconidiobolus thromboides FSU 785]|nr:hypothetical protein K502DRAFT_347004 [Neoconidiobolus thromboides FSU 785]